MSKRITSISIGQVFGRLTTLSETTVNSRSAWNCICICGNEKTTLSKNLLRGAVKSCGCLQKEVEKICSITHGGTRKGNKNPIYKLWTSMKARCLNPNSSHYPYYGGRGIKVCKRWEKFENFLEDMGDRPSPQHTLERIDNNGDYCKENCKWATRSEQSRNTKNTIKLTYDGQVFCLKDLCKLVGFNYRKAINRMHYYSREIIEELIPGAKLVTR